MKGEKQSRLDNVEKRMAAMTNVMQQVINELAMIKDLSVGTLETMKLLPDYKDALEKLKQKNEEMQQMSKTEKKLEVPDE
jgi:cell shape-determining protein MreC